MAVIGLLAVLATLVTAILAPFTAVGAGWVLLCLVVAVGAFVALRAMAVRDRNRKMMLRWEQVRREAMGPSGMDEPTGQVSAAAARKQEVFDARPDSGRRAPSVTAEELRAEALRVARGAGGVAKPATWEPTEVPKPKYVAAREATDKVREQVAGQVRPEPLPKAEPLRPSSRISLKAAEEAKRIASQVTDEQRAAVASLQRSTPADTGTNAATSVSPDAETTVVQEPGEEQQAPAARKDQAAETSRQRLNLDAVMQRRRA